MKTTLLALASLLAAAALAAGDTVRTVAWTDPTNPPTPPGTSLVLNL